MNITAKCILEVDLSNYASPSKMLIDAIDTEPVKILLLTIMTH